MFFEEKKDEHNDIVKYVDIINVRNVFNLLEKPLRSVKEDDIKNIENLTSNKTIYDYWESNDQGVTIKLYTYTSLAHDGVATRYFLMHFEREWWGGWTYTDTTKWYEISEQEYIKVRDYKITLN